MIYKEEFKDIDIKNIQAFLNKLDISETETKMYLSLLHLGSATITELAKITKVPRTTVHVTVERLIEKGLISQTIKGSRREILAENPRKIGLLITNREIELEMQLDSINAINQDLPTIIDAINAISPVDPSNSKSFLKYYEEKKGIRSIYYEAFSAKELRSYVNLAAVQRIFPENSRIYLACQQKKSSALVREIIDDSPESLRKANMYAQSPNFEFKVSPLPTSKTTLDILIFDNKVAMINFDERLTGSVIYNQDYYEHSKSIFDFMWKAL